MNKVEVCLTPDLITQHDLSGKLVVVVDIFRATSCIVSGLASGVRRIYPVLTVGECLENGLAGMITAGERGGQKLESFDIGNSPFDYMQDKFQGKDISVTTTNGTVAIKKSAGAAVILAGCFLNLSSTAQYLLETERPVLIHCAGWRGTPNVEDTLYAGALVHRLSVKGYEIQNDSAMMSLHFYEGYKDDLLKAGKSSAHAKRLGSFGVEKDIEFCMQIDKFDIVVRAEEDHLIKM